MHPLAKYSPLLNRRGGRYAPAVWLLDGVNDTMSVPQLSGSDSAAATFSCWVRFRSVSGNRQAIRLGGARIGSFGTDLEVGLLNNGGGPVVYKYASGFLAANTWYHIAMSHNTGPVGKIYINGVALTGVTVNSGNVYLSNSSQNAIGSTGGGSMFFNGDLAEVWMTNEYIDLATGLNKFVVAGRPVSLGPTGALPTGTQAKAYFRTAPPSENVNSGSCGNGTVSGGGFAASTQVPSF